MREKIRGGGKGGVGDEKKKSARRAKKTVLLSLPLSLSSLSLSIPPTYPHQRPLRRLRQLVPQVHRQQRRHDAQPELDPPDVVEVADVLEDQRLEGRRRGDGDERGGEDADALHGEDGADEGAAVAGGGELRGDGGGELFFLWKGGGFFLVFFSRKGRK